MEALCCGVGQVMINPKTSEPRYISDGYELEGFELPVSVSMALNTFWKSHLGEHDLHVY